MAEPKIYPKGIRTFAKHANAPSFVKGTVVINPNELFSWLKDNTQHLTEYQGNKQLKLQLLENDKGLYFVVDTFKPTAKPVEKLADNANFDKPTATSSKDFPF